MNFFFRNRLIFCISILLYAFSSIGQYRRGADDEKSNVKSISLTTSYSFSFKDNSLQVQEAFSSDFQALSGASGYPLRVYYDDQSEIGDFKYRAIQGVRHKPSRVCGHVPSGSYFFSDVKMCLFNLFFESAGDQASFSYDKLYKDYRYFTRAFFHQDFDIDKRTIVFQFPEGLQVDLIEINFDGFDIHKTVTEEGRKVTYEMGNLRKITGSGDHTYLRTVPHILPVVRSYSGTSGTPGEMMTNTASLYKWYKQLVGQKGEISSELKDLADSLCARQTTELGKVKTIYYWVQANIRYLAFEDGIAGFRPESPDIVYYNRYGDCKGMANLLKALLIYKNFDARLTWLGTDVLPYTYDIPSLAVDNHMICTVLLEKDTIYLDATEKFQPLGINAPRIQGKEVLIEDGENYIVALVPDGSGREDALSNHVQLSIANNTIQGRGKLTLTGEYKKILKEFLGLIEKKDKHKILNLVLPDGELENFQIDSLSTFDRDADFQILYSFSDTYNVNSFGEETYISFPHMKPLFFLNKLDDSDWLLHKIGLRSEMNTTIDIKLPPGTSVNHLPQNFHIVDDHYSFVRQSHLDASTLSLSYHYKILNTYLPNTLKSKWNTDIDIISKREKETIILTKSK